jgi:hypothetical protein
MLRIGGRGIGGFSAMLRVFDDGVACFLRGAVINQGVADGDTIHIGPAKV